jgi:hypothetical protein
LTAAVVGFGRTAVGVLLNDKQQWWLLRTKLQFGVLAELCMEVYGLTDVCWQGAVQLALQGLRASRCSGASF